MSVDLRTCSFSSNPLIIAAIFARHSADFDISRGVGSEIVWCMMREFLSGNQNSELPRWLKNKPWRA
jgi:hypothetical protein